MEKILQALVVDSTTMDDLEHTDPLPSDVLFWKLSLKCDDTGNIIVEYSGVATYRLAGVETINDVMADVLNGTQPVAWLPPTEYNPKRTPLSIQNNLLRYLVFVLDSGNYEFSDQQVPFTVERNKAPFCRHARAAWKDNAGAVQIKYRPALGSSCHAAYFVARSDEDLLDSGGVSFITRFNIYLDIMIPQSGGAPDRPVPITVDPDVGYPGGNNP